MPNLADPNVNTGKLLRELPYGPSQTKKTLWSGRAAEAGFNICLLDGDGHYQILNTLSDEAKKRVHIIRAVDKLMKPQFGRLICSVFRGLPVLWDDFENEIIYNNPNPEHGHYYIDLTLFNSNDVLVIDGWLALSWSVAWDYSLVHGYELDKAEKQDWDLYGFVGRQLNWILGTLEGAPCHVIVVGHETTYQKSRSKKINNRTIMEPIGQPRVQIQSSSGPHAQLVPKYFDDCLRFSITGNNSFKIDGRTWEDADGGSRVIPEQRSWDEFQFIDLIKATGCALPDSDTMPGCIYYPPGELPEDIQIFSANKPLAAAELPTAKIANQATAVATGGLAALIGANAKGTKT